MKYGEMYNISNPFLDRKADEASIQLNLCSFLAELSKGYTSRISPLQNWITDLLTFIVIVCVNLHTLVYLCSPTAFEAREDISFLP